MLRVDRAIERSLLIIPRFAPLYSHNKKCAVHNDIKKPKQWHCEAEHHNQHSQCQRRSECKNTDIEQVTILKPGIDNPVCNQGDKAEKQEMYKFCCEMIEKEKNYYERQESPANKL